MPSRRLGSSGRLRPCRFEITPIADTSGEFHDFAPFVPAVNDAGTVAFQATLLGGMSGVFIGGTGTVPTMLLMATDPYSSICSHPDIDASGGIVCYADLPTGERAVVVSADGRAKTVALDAGPLGPTINDHGTVAFRTERVGASSDIQLANGDALTRIASTGDGFSAFHGLPAINGSGGIAFRADLIGGGSAICVAREAQVAAVAETGSTFDALGQFPVLADDGLVGTVARLVNGISGVFVLSGDDLEAVLDTTGAFESFRGVLLTGDGSVFFYGTPRGGELGIFSGPDPSQDRILGIGDPLYGSTIVEFALNPVSINRAGQLAIRVMLADDRQWIVRADPVGGSARETSRSRPTLRIPT